MAYVIKEWYRFLRDYVVADVDNLGAVEETTLRKKAASVKFPLTHEDEDDIADLVWSFDSKRDGVIGLSAPQIGIAKRILVIRVLPYVARNHKRQEFRKTVWINPRYYNATEETEVGWEQCFSVKEYVGQVRRFKHIVYSGFHENGSAIRGRADGFAARIILHEIDHLDGKLFIDHIPREELVTRDQFMKMFLGPDKVPLELEKIGPIVSALPWN